MGAALDAHISEHLTAISKEIWGTMLHEDLSVQDATTCAFTTPLYSGSVDIGGPYRIRVQVIVPKDLLSSATSNLYELHNTEIVTEEQMVDLLKEVTNLTAGNLKNQIPDSSSLTIPLVRLVGTTELARMKRDADLFESYSAREYPVFIAVAHL